MKLLILQFSPTPYHFYDLLQVAVITISITSSIFGPNILLSALSSKNCQRKSFSSTRSKEKMLFICFFLSVLFSLPSYPLLRICSSGPDWDLCTRAQHFISIKCSAMFHITQLDQTLCFPDFTPADLFLDSKLKNGSSEYVT
jgi:hypothetical protein